MSSLLYCIISFEWFVIDAINAFYLAGVCRFLQQMSQFRVFIKGCHSPGDIHFAQVYILHLYNLDF